MSYALLIWNQNLPKKINAKIFSDKTKQKYSQFIVFIFKTSEIMLFSSIFFTDIIFVLKKIHIKIQNSLC